MLEEIVNQCTASFGRLSELGEQDQIDAINLIREKLHELSPMNGQPVDFVRWVPLEDVVANDYNPNSVAAPEMKLLSLSIEADGFTQPIVTYPEGAKRTVVDGFHRSRVGREVIAVSEKCKGRLPVTTIRADRSERNNRIAATIRHNRARGKHSVEAMSQIVVELTKRNWTDKLIAKELGMEPDEVLRLKQTSGLAEAFSNREFSEAWEAIEKTK